MKGKSAGKRVTILRTFEAKTTAIVITRCWRVTPKGKAALKGSK
jgi:hypothetical protein